MDCFKVNLKNDDLYFQGMTTKGMLFWL